MSNTINRSAVNTVWKWRNTNQYPVIVKDITNLINSSNYPTMVTFETVKEERLSLPANVFLASLERTDASLMKFVALRKTLSDFT